MAISNRIENSLYQSTFLPIIERATTELKKLVVFYALNLKPKWELQAKIKGLIKAVDEKLPKDLINRQTYIRSLEHQADKLVREFYDMTIRRFYTAMSVLLLMSIKAQPKTPLEMYKLVGSKEFKQELDKRPDLKYEAKGYPQVENYQKELTTRIEKLSKEPIDADSGISLWQKAEIDLRHEKQMDHLQELKDSGVRYAWISSHPDCSKRCQKWQGKLFDILAPSSEMSGFRMRKKLDGNTVYCLEDVINQTQTTKAGRVYKNNILVGFSCRHRLIPYNGQPAPTEYTADEIKLEREINAKLREYEREIRKCKQLAILHKSTNPKLAKQYESKANRLFREYTALCNKYGFAIQNYRIKV